MRILTKTILIVVICITLPISIYYGLRILNSNFIFEYINRSYVVTLPNKVWFEINTSTDELDEEMIFEKNIPEVSKEGIDIGLQYPIYTLRNRNGSIEKTQTAQRIGDRIEIEQELEVGDGEYQTYTTYIHFSQKGIFSNNTYTQDGCNVSFNSEVGEISYNEENSILKIIYELNESRVEDNILIDIECN